MVCAARNAPDSVNSGWHRPRPGTHYVLERVPLLDEGPRVEPGERPHQTGDDGAGGRSSSGVNLFTRRPTCPNAPTYLAGEGEAPASGYTSLSLTTGQCSEWTGPEQAGRCHCFFRSVCAGGRGPARRIAGGGLMGLCPLHADHKPSLLPDPNKNLFYCYGCIRGGDVIRFAELYHGVPFSEAIALLRRWVWRGGAARRRG